MKIALLPALFLVCIVAKVQCSVGPPSSSQYVAFNTVYSKTTYNGKSALKLTLNQSYLKALTAADTEHILNANAYLLFPSIFYDGTIDLDLALIRNNNSYDFTAFGQTLPVAGFGGVVFHAADTNNYDAVYLRGAWGALNSVQYLSWPKYSSYSYLPSQYNGPVGTAVTEGAWTHMKLSIYNNTLSVYIGGSSTPAISNVALLGTNNQINRKQIGLFVDANTDAYFANVVANRFTHTSGSNYQFLYTNYLV